MAEPPSRQADQVPALVNYLSGSSGPRVRDRNYVAEENQNVTERLAVGAVAALPGARRISWT